MWLEEHAVIRRSPAEVFAFMDDADQQARVTPGVSEVRDVRRLENGGMACRFIYRLLGFELSESVIAAAYDPPHYVEYEVTGPISARLFGRYRPHADGTLLELAANYELPGILDNAVFKSMATRINAWALRTMIRGMTRELEAERRAA